MLAAGAGAVLFAFGLAFNLGIQAGGGIVGNTVEVERAGAVEMRGFDPAGKPGHFDACGLMARVLPHEIDHLAGVLIIDRGVPSATPALVARPATEFGL